MSITSPLRLVFFSDFGDSGASGRTGPTSSRKMQMRRDWVVGVLERTPILQVDVKLPKFRKRRCNFQTFSFSESTSPLYPMCSTHSASTASYAILNLSCVSSSAQVRQFTNDTSGRMHHEIVISVPLLVEGSTLGSK